MTLKNCKECNKEVSTKANSCPHCGVKNPTTKSSDVVVGVLTLVVIVFVVSKCSSSSDSTKDKQTAESKVPQVSETEKKAQCKADLQCWGDAGLVGAGVYCKESVEKLGNYSHRWTDGTFETKFSRFRWLDKTKGTITFVGDKIEFQNGFGAYQPAVYECDFDQETKEVLDVRAKPGRL